MLASCICITTAFKASHEFVGGAVEAVPLVVTCLAVMLVHMYSPQLLYRSIRYAAPRLRNELPKELRESRQIQSPSL